VTGRETKGDRKKKSSIQAIERKKKTAANGTQEEKALNKTLDIRPGGWRKEGGLGGTLIGIEQVQKNGGGVGNNPSDRRDAKKREAYCKRVSKAISVRRGKARRE